MCIPFHAGNKNERSLDPLNVIMEEHKNAGVQSKALKAGLSDHI